MINTSSNMLFHIGNLNTESQRISYQMATGKNQELGSEDAMLHASLISIEDKLRVTESLKLQINKSNVVNELGDTSFQELKLTIDSIKSDLMKGLNAGMDRSDKLALATNLKGIRENMYDLVNVKVDNEYVFAGSNTTTQTFRKDDDFELNGKIEYQGDGFLREIAVQPGSYRDRGVTGYEVMFSNFSTYDGIEEDSIPSEWDGVANAGEPIVFEQGDKIIDNDGYEWKQSLAGDTMQKYDHNGVIFHPPIEIDLFRTNESHARIDLGMGANTDATGSFTITIDGAANSPYTATGADAATVFADLKSQLEVDGFNVSANLDHDDKFNINSADGSKMVVNVSSTDPKYTTTASNEIEASGGEQARKATWTFTVPSTAEYEGAVFEAKHNYFDELNVIINALEGFSTKLDGTKGLTINDANVRETLVAGLDMTTTQFDATNIGHGELGGRNAVFEVAYERLESQTTHYDILLQETGSADKAKLAMESKSLEMTYQALYSTISKMNSMSLVNFIN